MTYELCESKILSHYWALPEEFSLAENFKTTFCTPIKIQLFSNRKYLYHKNLGIYKR